MSDPPQSSERLKCLFRQAKAAQDLDDAINSMDKCIDDLTVRLNGKFSRPTAKIKRGLAALREVVDLEVKKK